MPKGISTAIIAVIAVVAAASLFYFYSQDSFPLGISSERPAAPIQEPPRGENMQPAPAPQETPTAYVKDFIVSNPVDLAQIKRISKYRSCAGHETKGYNSDGELEEKRSMKHYLEPVEQFADTIDSVRLYAPFDGSIYRAVLEESRGYEIYLQSPVSGELFLVFYHSSLIPSLQEGSPIKAGELIGYAYIAGGSDFDVGVESAGGLAEYSHILELPEEEQKKFFKENLAIHLPKRYSMFDHMSADVYNQFASRGISSDNIIISKEFRDSNPCMCIDEQCYFEEPHGHPRSWVNLKLE